MSLTGLEKYKLTEPMWGHIRVQNEIRKFRKGVSARGHIRKGGLRNSQVQNHKLSETRLVLINNLVSRFD